MLRHLVTEDFLFEDVKKSDAYGSVSSVVKVRLNFNTSVIMLLECTYNFVWFQKCVGKLGLSSLDLLDCYA